MGEFAPDAEEKSRREREMMFAPSWGRKGRGRVTSGEGSEGSVSKSCGGGGGRGEVERLDLTQGGLGKKDIEEKANGTLEDMLMGNV